MKTLLTLIMLAGLATAIVVPAASGARATALWSDFLTFQNRVQSDPAGERILNYGGDDDKENFSILLERLLHLNDSNLAQMIGYSISILALAGIILDSNKTKNANKIR